MNRYTIYCTREQTKKAFELGAPIDHWGHISNLIAPTAEQMIGWLDEKGITIEMAKCEIYWFARAYSDENTNFNKGRFNSRKEAMFAAIDAALDYLMENKK